MRFSGCGVKATNKAKQGTSGAGQTAGKLA
jgi:hypothetical protein